MALGAATTPEPGAAFTDSGLRTVALLDVDPDLGARMERARFEVARHQLRTRTVTLPRGNWAGAEMSGAAAGLLVLDGVLAREVVLEDTISTELLGPGDLICPWSGEEEPQLLQQQVRWQVLAEARLAVLGTAFANAMLRFPELNAVLTRRAVTRAQRLATTQAISHLNSVERRLCALFWHLAERWGRVTGDGVVVPLTLSHRLLGELIGARRPTVTTALAALEREGAVRRRADATWLLTGEPPGAPSEHVRRVVSHRRRLLSRTSPALTVVEGAHEA